MNDDIEKQEVVEYDDKEQYEPGTKKRRIEMTQTVNKKTQTVPKISETQTGPKMIKMAQTVPKSSRAQTVISEAQTVTNMTQKGLEYSGAGQVNPLSGPNISPITPLTALNSTLDSNFKVNTGTINMNKVESICKTKSDSLKANPNSSNDKPGPLNSEIAPNLHLYLHLYWS